VTTGSSDRMRRIVTGLMVLVALVMSVGQVLALPLVGVPLIHAVLHGESEAGLAPADAAHDDLGSPCSHHACSHGIDCCCIGGACSMLSPWVPVATPAMPLIASRSLAYRDAVALSPDGKGAAPTVPPPRQVV
jgi:hypothetical protein